MTEFEGLYKAVVDSGPKEIERYLAKIPGIHQQEALDSSLEKAVSLAKTPSVQNVKFLLKLGADPNGPSGDEGIVLNYAYSSGLEHIVELLLQAGADVNAVHSNVLEQAVRNGDTKYVVRFVDAGANIHDKTKLLYTDDLLRLAAKYPKVQKYLVEQGISGASAKLIEQLRNIETPTIDNFEYPNPGYKPGAKRKLPQYRGDKEKQPQIDIDPFLLEQEQKPSVKPIAVAIAEPMNVQNYSGKYCVVRGNTKEYQKLLRKYGGRYIPKAKGWLIPISKRKVVEEEIADLCTIPEQSIDEEIAVTPPTPEEGTPVTDSPTPTPIYSITPASDTSSPDEVDDLIKNIVTSNTITRPVVEEQEDIELYTPVGDYGYMTCSYTRPKLFYLDNHYWDSIERYLMYKMYEGTHKARAIRDAETLNDARRKFNVTTVPAAKTPKQLVLNQKLQPLVKSAINSKYLQHREQLFERANRAKFNQNRMYANKLVNTGDKDIINRNSRDIFGYEGNMLGNTLMILREDFGGAEYDRRNIRKTNSLVFEKYPGNRNFYVIRGDPTIDLATEIRGIGTYRTKNGKVIRGKLNLNLQGGPGWLIPASNKDEAEELVFETYPNEKKIEVAGREWVQKRMKKFLEIAILFSRFRGHQEVGADDLLFSIKDVFGGEDFLGDDNNRPADHFTKALWKYVEEQDAIISDAAIQLLWDFLSKMVLEFTQGIETYPQMKDIMNKIEASVLETTIKPNVGLTERESIIVDSFNRLFKLLRRINDNESKVCVTAVHMMLGKHHYEKIREIYSKKAKLQGNNEYPDEETQFRRRFNIKSNHIQAVLDVLPKNISRKCKLLVLTTLDYVMSLDGDDAISISKRLIILSQRGKQPTPTPKTPTPRVPEESDIPKIPLKDDPSPTPKTLTPKTLTPKTLTPKTLTPKTPTVESETPPFDGTPEEDDEE